MTREELWNEVYNENSNRSDYAEAIDMAISALSAEQTERHLPDYTYEAEMAQRLKQQTEPKKDCTDFLCWLLEEVIDEENWEINAEAYGEVIARKLKKLGLLDTKNGYYIRTPMYEALTEPIDLKGQETIVAMSVQRAKEKAIKTLRAKPSDLISRIKPSDLSNSGWIPITEREPDTAEHVLVTVKWADDDLEVCEIDYGVIKAEPTPSGEIMLKHIIAWQPMPKPYEEYTTLSTERVGGWIGNSGYGVCCSVCGKYPYAKESTWNYCPFCGAKMKGDM